MNDSATQALIDECDRQFENCRDTAASFTIWLRTLRWTRALCLVAPVIFGALATWQVLTGSYPILAAVFTLLASIAILSKLSIDVHIPKVRSETQSSDGLP